MWLPTLFVRKQAKTYGTCQLAEGGRVRGRRLAVIEDVVTSGGQVIESCREHLFLARTLSKRFPETEPQIIYRVYLMDRALARSAPKTKAGCSN